MRKLFYILCVLFLASCTRTIYVPHDVVREIYIDRLAHDTTIITQTDIVREKADTVYIEKVRTEYRYITKTDTEVRVDSIPYVVEVQVPVEQPQPSWGERTKKNVRYMGIGALLTVIAGLVWKFRSPIKGFIRKLLLKI